VAKNTEIDVARAKRHYIPGQIWHITHRCHKREFLLKFSNDRHRWFQWLFEARRRFGLTILNDTVTSNHIHLLVADDKGRDVIPDSIKLIAGRTEREFNQRGPGKVPTGKPDIMPQPPRVEIIYCSALYILTLGTKKKLNYRYGVVG
jgi:REP element-mobilizing transposase RayT